MPLDGFYIETIKTYMKGFIVGGNKGQILIYEKTDDPKNPYTRVATLPQAPGEGSKALDGKNKAHVMRAVRESRIKYMDLSKLEDVLIFSTENNQMFKMKINLERPTDGAEYEYLVYPFHYRQILGMDVCIKKNLIATCG